LLHQDELALIGAHRDALEIDSEAEALLVRSAVWSDYDADYWLERAALELRATALREAIASDDAARRQRSAALAGRFAVLPLGDLLADLMQADPDALVRRAAAFSLARMDSDRFIAHLQTMLDGPPDHQQLALEAIANVQDAGLEMPGFEQLARFNLQWRLRWLRLRRNRARRNIMTLYAALGGATGAGIGGLAGAILSGAGDKLPIATALAFMFGLGGGAGVGLGFGTVEAMDERRDSLIYVAGAALGGGIAGTLNGLGNKWPFYALLGAVIGLAWGAVCGGSVAIVVNLTAGIVAPARRLAMRLAFGLVASLISGAISALGAYENVLPIGLPYGFALGLATPGIAGGLELAERRLKQTRRPGEAVRANESREAKY
jgi:hypothetical protein